MAGRKGGLCRRKATGHAGCGILGMAYPSLSVVSRVPGCGGRQRVAKLRQSGEGCSSHAGGSTPAQCIFSSYGLLKGFKCLDVLEGMGCLVFLAVLANSVFMRVSAGSAALRHPQRG